MPMQLMLIAFLAAVLYDDRHRKDEILHMLCQRPALTYTRLSEVYHQSRL
jgi:hypothetical protein